MDHFAGLDVSVKATSVCIVDDTGKVVREVKVTSEPDRCRNGCSALSPSNDARGIAQMMRVGLYRPVHVKTLRSQKLAPPCLNFLTKKAPYKGLGADSEEKREPVSDID